MVGWQLNRMLCGIQMHNTVEEGLELDKADLIDELQIRVGQLLQEF